MKKHFLFGSLTLLLVLLSWWLASPQIEKGDDRRPVRSQAVVSLPDWRRPSGVGQRPKAVADFLQWAEHQSADAQLGRMEEGMALVEAHREAMKELIQTDPQRALESAVPMVVRQKLPAPIRDRLEERVQEMADVEVLAVSEDADPREPRVRRFTQAGDREWRTYVYGRRAGQQSLSQVPVYGVALDGMLALSESPLRVMEVGEWPAEDAARVEKCPVSGKSTAVEVPAAAVEEEQVAVQVGKQIVYLCDGGHIRLFEEELIAGEGGTGGTTGISAPAATSFSNGPRNLLYMRLAFPDDLVEPQTEAAAWENIRQLNSFFQEISYGKIFYLAAVPPLIILPKTESWYQQDYNVTGSNSPIMNDAKDAARRLGYNPDNYQHFTVVYSGGPGSFGGLGSVGGANVWLRSTGLGVFAHEIGHNVGLWHGNSWNAGGRDVIGGGGNSEYGNSYDVLGSSGSVSGNKGHFMSPHKNQMNWLPNAQVSTATTSGLYRLFPMDQTILDPQRRYALKIAKDADRDYWVEFRQKYNADHRWFRDGVVLNWSSWGEFLDTSSVGSNGGGQFLDTTPGSADGKNDGPVVIGRTFSDRESGIHITPVGKGGTTPESMDVMVQVGDFPSNQAPVIQSLSASTTTPAVNGTVTFTVDAVDADGDSLAYFWDFGDATYGSNAASVSKQFTTARHHAVRCLVSDMKGGEVSKLMLITVGTPTTFTATGRVLDGSGNPIREVRVDNGSTGGSFRGAWTDSNGDFIVTHLAAGTVTLTPVLGGYAFSPVNRSVTVGPSATAVNYTASESTRLTVEAVDGAAAETGANGGTLRLTRTGPTTAALTVYADLQGDAISGTDYTLLPAAVTTLSPIESYTIPVGASTLDLTLTAVSDSTVEGPERLRLVLIPSTAYTITGKAAAEIVIADSGTNGVTNRVTVHAVDEDAEESGDVGRFEIRRQGDTTQALSVNFTLAGAASSQAAVNGADYALISSPVVIAAGQTSATVTLTPTQDSLVEGQETVQLSLSTHSSYGVGTPSSAILRLADDDIPTVTLTATDANAAEGGTDLGMFTVTRTGDTSAALVVDYTIGGSALHGTDYLALPGTLTIPAGSATAGIPIVPIDDLQGEPAQTVLLQLRNDPRFTLGTSHLATVTITDNDLPVVAIGVSDSTCNEPNATGSFRVTTTGTGGGNITVRYAVSGTATSGTDFTALTGTLSVAKNTTATITVTPMEDVLLENAESVILTILPDPAYLVDVLQSTSTLVIRDNDSANTVNVSFTTTSMAENAGSSKLWFSRVGSTGSAVTAGALTVNFSATGTASPGVDCSALTGSVVIPDGASGVELALTGINDTVAEGTELLTVSLTSGGYSIERGVASLLITDDETSGFSRTASFASRQTVMTEGDAPRTIPVQLSNADPVNPITVEYVIDTNSATGSGVDTNLIAGTLVFAPGEVEKHIPVSVADDGQPELEEHLTLKLNTVNAASLNNSSIYHTLFIRDNEPRLHIEAADAVAYESTGDSASFLLTRTGPLTTSMPVTLSVSGTATSGSDYTGFSSTPTFGIGQRQILVPLTAIADGLAEGTETVLITAQPSSRYVIAGQATISLSVLDTGTDHPPSVRLVRPLRSEVAMAAVGGLWVEADVSDDGAPGSASLVWSLQSGPAAVTWGSTTATATSVQFSSPGRYVLRCTATDAAAQSSFAEVGVTVRSGSALWAGFDIGITGTNATGASDVRGDLLQNQAAGSGITGTSDSFRLTATDLTGDGEIVARFEGMDGAFGSARPGLMIRDGTANNVRFAAITFNGPSNMSWLTRANVGASPANTTASVLPGPRWLRITRSGNNFSGFHSADGVTWTQLGATTSLSLGTSVKIGTCMTSASSARPARALFSNVRVSGVADNAAPVTQAAPTSTLSSAAFKQLDGTVTDDVATAAEPNVIWSQVSGPGSSLFSNATDPDSQVQFSAPGSYVLRLRADDGEVTSYADVTVQVTFATLGFGSSTPAAELGNSAGSLTLTRTGELDMPLTTAYASGGSASAPVDYASLTGSAVFAAGQNSTVIQVSPQTDALAEGDEAVQITLLPGPGYFLPATTTSTLLVKDLPIDAWRFQQFGAQANNPAVAGDLADSNQDGIVTLLEYALGLEAGSGRPEDLPKPDHDAGQCQLIYTRPIAVSDLVYVVEWSTSLSGWSSVGVSEQVIATQGSLQTVRASVTPPNGEAKCFMRLRVERL